MTTILYDHKNKQVAVDSRKTTGRGVIHDDNADKTINSNGGKWITSGDCSESLSFSMLNHGDKIDSPFECHAMLIKEGAVYLALNVNGHKSVYKLESNMAIGTGDEFALAALDFGKTAREAVEYAITKDMHSGGKVRVFNLDGEEIE